MTTIAEQYKDFAETMKHKKTAKAPKVQQYGLNYVDADYYNYDGASIITPANKVLTVTASAHDCHSGCKRVLYMPGKDQECGLYLGGWSRGAKPKADWAVIDLTGIQTDTRGGSSFVPMNPAAKEAFSTLSTPTGPWLAAKVQDYGVPTWTRDDWALLIECMRNLLHAGTSIFIGCTGGHGRTGMIGAIATYQLAANKSIFDPDPVTWLRKLYCSHIVETQEQMKYIWDILELTASMPEAAKKTYQDHWKGQSVPSCISASTTTPSHAMRIHASNYTKPAPTDCWICARGASKGTPSTINNHIVCEPCAQGNATVKLCYFCDAPALLVSLLPSWWDTDDVKAFGVDMLPKVCFTCLRVPRIDQSMVACDTCGIWTNLQVLNIDHMHSKITCSKCKLVQPDTAKDKPLPQDEIIDADIITQISEASEPPELTKIARPTCFLCGGLLFALGQREISYTDEDTGVITKRQVHLGCTHVAEHDVLCYRCGKALSDDELAIVDIPYWWTADEAAMFDEFIVPLCNKCISEPEK